MKNLVFEIIFLTLCIKRHLTAGQVTCQNVEGTIAGHEDVKAVVCWDDLADGCANDEDGCTLKAPCADFENRRTFQAPRQVHQIEKSKFKFRFPFNATKFGAHQGDLCDVSIADTIKDTVGRVLAQNFLV